MNLLVKQLLFSKFHNCSTQLTEQVLPDVGVAAVTALVLVLLAHVLQHQVAVHLQTTLCYFLEHESHKHTLGTHFMALGHLTKGLLSAWGPVYGLLLLLLT